ncbi:RHS repeat-associated core domain-containing protein [Lentisphaerota bacterium WC36G]|nr:hypothetical protein LJT99_15010 [Lentisphaerae bacterium WC36]
MNNLFKFSSEYFDNETNLCYYNYRYYNPTNSKWTKHDPIGEFTKYNEFNLLYGFVKNNPLFYIDLLRLVKADTDKWNEEGTQGYNNCYSYALNDMHGPTHGDIYYGPVREHNPQPRDASVCRYKKSDDRLQYCAQIMASARRDYSKDNVKYSTQGKNCDKCYHKVVLFIEHHRGKSIGYHWYRQNSNALWPHKPVCY